MLVLLRAVGKKLKIGNDITVSILGLEGNAVRIGVEAPETVAVRAKQPAESPPKEKDKRRHRGQPVES